MITQNDKDFDLLKRTTHGNPACREALQRIEPRIEDLHAHRAAIVETLEEALAAIEGPEDQGQWIEVYRSVGGGYRGLQAIARRALTPTTPPKEA